MLTLSIISFLVLFGTQVKANCPGFDNAENEKAPELQFSTMKRMDNHIKIEKENATILINRTMIFEIRLDCWASYPIDLTFSGHVTNQQAKVKTYVSTFKGQNGMKNHCYRINVTLETYEEITGNYSCFKVANPMTRSSKYIYVYSAAPPGVLLRRGRNITLFVEPNQKSVILPCAVSDPNAGVELLAASDGNPLLLSDNLRFDPKIGYTMTLGKSVVGKYICKTHVSPNDTVYIKLSRPNALVASPNLTMIRLKLGDQLNLHCMYSKDEVYIELKSNDLNVSLPQILTSSSSSKDSNSSSTEEPYYKGWILKTDTFENAVRGVATCRNKSNNASVHVWQFIVQNVTKKAPGVLDSSEVMNYCHKPDKTMTLVLYECSNWVECNINRCLRNESTCQTNTKCPRQWSCFPNGLIQCVSSTGAISEMFFTGFNTTPIKYTNGMVAPVNDILRLQMESPKKVSKKVTGNSVNFICEGSNFVLSAGFQWSLGLKDGSVVDVNEQYEKYNAITKIKETWGHTQSIIMSTLTLDTKPETLNKVKLVICSAPVWNATKWINQTLDFTPEMKQILLDKKNVTSSAKGNSYTFTPALGFISTTILSFTFLSVIQYM